MITARENPKAPHNQVFNSKGKIDVKKNSKKNAWYRKAIQTNNVSAQLESGKSKKKRGDTAEV